MIVAKTKQKTAKNASESQYFLKMVLFLILGSFWLRIGDGSTWQIPIPVGLLIGLLLTRSERFKIDRKIEYAVLLIAMFIGFWTPLGLNIRL